MNIFNPQQKPVHLQPVKSIQAYLREISRFYEDIPRLIPDGIYGPETTKAVRQFQFIFGLPVTGVVDLNTWDLLVFVFEELKQTLIGPVPIYPVSFHYKATPECPDCVLEPGDSGDPVLMLQIMLRSVGEKFDNIRQPQITGEYDRDTAVSVRNFQQVNQLQDTGAVNRQTWNQLAKFYNIHGVERDLPTRPYQNFTGNL